MPRPFRADADAEAISRGQSSARRRRFRRHAEHDRGDGDDVDTARYIREAGRWRDQSITRKVPLRAAAVADICEPLIITTATTTAAPHFRQKARVFLMIADAGAFGSSSLFLELVGAAGLSFRGAGGDDAQAGLCLIRGGRATICAHSQFHYHKRLPRRRRRVISLCVGLRGFDGFDRKRQHDTRADCWNMDSVLPFISRP